MKRDLLKGRQLLTPAEANARANAQANAQAAGQAGGRGRSANLRVVLAGNPNAGKTSLFNALTGARQRVGNYPGVTVERREGVWHTTAGSVTLRDLPGTYSLSGYSPEERIARDELLSGDHDLVVVVVDSTVLRRGLVFLLQVLRTGANAVLCLNMADEARRAGQRLDTAALSERLGIPVVETAAHVGEGLADLRRAVFQAASLGAGGAGAAGPSTDSGAATDTAIRRAPEVIAALAPAGVDQPGIAGAPDLSDPVERARRDQAVVDTLLLHTLLKSARPDARVVSDRIDTIVAHRILGLPIFLAVMYGIFWVTFTLGAPLMDLIEQGIGGLSGLVAALWPGAPDSPLLSLLVDGILAGVGGVLVFLPNIVLLFLGLSLLEDTGYMARAAFLMDRFLSRFGLHGKSFLPLVTGFGCSIPGIMATRTIENDRDRLVTMLVLPLMSCGARLPIWLLVIPAFFPQAWHAPALWGVYVVGILLALGLARLLRGTVLRGEPTPFVMELPPYRVPPLRSVVLRMSERAGVYLRKAGTVILGISILLWAATTYPQPDAFAVDARLAAGDPAVAQLSAEQLDGMRAAEALESSLAGRVGRALEPAFQPLGFDWRLVTASIGAFAAKEVFVSQLSIVYALGGEGDAGDLRSMLRADYTPLVAMSLVLFLLIGTPCMATVAVTRRESGRWSWALLQFGGLTALAYLIALVVYQAGSLVT